MASVVIAGAGPAGAALGYLLAERGARVELLERQTDFAREFRGEGLMPSGLDALVQMGLEKQLDALPQSRVSGVDLYREGQHVAHVEPADLPGIPQGPRMVSQPAMLEMLVSEAARFASFTLHRGVTVRDVLRDGERIVGVRADTPDGSREFRGDFVIGADGRASVLRRRSGLHEEQPAESFDVVWFKLPLPEFLADRRTARAYLSRGHLTLMFPAPDGRLQIAWIIEKGSFGELRRQGINAWLDEFASVVSDDLARHVREQRANVTDPFLLDVVCDHLERWCTPGLLLLGDACHPMSPVGAQGLNIALRDALVAANHLGPLLRGAPEPAALDAAAKRVQDERLPEVEAIQALQRRAPNVLFQRTAFARFVIGVIAPFLARTGLLLPLAGNVVRRFANGTTQVVLEPASGADSQ
jgi:2-polyprenyl-6-methoxyphenol hydroxylase-like FAD-dependent oxidoreductase